MYTKQDYARALAHVDEIIPNVSGGYISALRELGELKADDKANLPAFDFDAVEKREVTDVLERLAGTDYPDDVSGEYADASVSVYTWDLKCAALAFSQWEESACIESKPDNFGWVEYVGQMCWYEAARGYAEEVKQAAEKWIYDNEEESN